MGLPDLPYWLISVIAFILTAIARDKEWHILKAIFFVIAVMTGTVAAIVIWVGNFIHFI